MFTSCIVRWRRNNSSALWKALIPRAAPGAYPSQDCGSHTEEPFSKAHSNQAAALHAGTAPDAAIRWDRFNRAQRTRRLRCCVLGLNLFLRAKGDLQTRMLSGSSDRDPPRLVTEQDHE